MYKMKHLEVSGAVRRFIKSLGFKGLKAYTYPALRTAVSCSRMFSAEIVYGADAVAYS